MSAGRWARTWPALLGVVVVGSVGAPAAVASYRHARDVIATNGDPVMAPWLALSTDGMLLASLVVIWVRRHRGQAQGRGPWAAFWAGMAATVAANLAAAQSTVIGVVVALWPPVCLAITLELSALIVYGTIRAHRRQTQTARQPAKASAPVQTPLPPVQAPVQTPVQAAVPAQPVRKSRSTPADGPTDAEILAEVRTWSGDRLSRNNVMRAFKVGTSRASRVVEMVQGQPDREAATA